MSEHKIPTIQDLYENKEVAFKNDAFNLLLHSSPPQAWVQKHPMIAKVRYLAIDKIEYLLTRIFQKWRVQVISYNALFNSVAVHVRLHYLNPVSKEWEYQDGVGAAPVQTDSGKTAADLSAIKTAAIQMALPAAESYAIKDAAEKLGDIFGKNLNRKGAVAFDSMFPEGETGKAPTKEGLEVVATETEAIDGDKVTVGFLENESETQTKPTTKLPNTNEL